MPLRLVAFTLLTIAVIGCSGDRQRGKIVFQSNRDGNFEIYSMRDDGTGLTRLTNTPSYDVSPSWSPNGSRILFASDRDGNWDIYVMNADGSQPQRLTRPPGSNTDPSWAIDGKRILFVSTRDTLSGDVYIMDAGGGGVERLTKDGIVKDSPAMSPNGKYLTYVARMGRHTSIVLKSSENAIVLPPFPADNCLSPSFSPDGSRIIFVSDHEGGMAAYEMAATGGEPKRLTSGKSDLRSPSYCSSETDIVYSSNGYLCMFSTVTKKEKILSLKGDYSPKWIND